MLTQIHLYVTVIFIVTVLLTLFLFLRATKNTIVTYIVLGWLLLNGILSYRGFYTDTSTIPPRFILATAPVLLTIILLFLTRKGRRFIDNLDLRSLTLISIVRIPVEVVLYMVFLDKAIPELMTFAGGNFDIFSGITAPLVYFACFNGTRVTNRVLLLAWNIICLGLLLNIVIKAILSAPFRFQQLAFDQPNIVVLYFPFIWLPCFIVMAVLFSHLVSIRRLLLR